jgi:branched-chain amino acid transport system substrate-binding protein
MYKKLSTVLALLIVASMALTACGGAGSGGSIKVGLLAPLSGSPPLAYPLRKAFKWPSQRMERQGRHLGKQIELIVADSQCSADPAVSAVTS